MRIMVSGCGYLGSRLAERLVARGHEVWGLRRRVGLLPEDVRPVGADLAEPGELRAVPAGLDGVVYAVSAGAGTEAAYRAAYVEGVRNLIGELRGRGAPLPRFVFVSSSSVYGASGGEWVDEATPPEPEGFRGRVLLEGERLVEDLGAAGIVVRLTGIYGPGRTRLMKQLLAGAPLEAAGEPVYVNHIHVDDAAGALAHVLELDRPERLYLGTDCEPATRAEIAGWLAEELGVELPKVESEGTEPPRGNKRCSNRRLLESGYRFRYPTFREGYRELLGEVTREERE